MPRQPERHTILVVAFTHRLAASVSRNLQRQLPSMPRPCRIVTLAFEQVGADLELDDVLRSGSLRACVFALERGGFEEPAKTKAPRDTTDPAPWALGDGAEPDRPGYRACLELMADMVMDRDDFRLMVLPPVDDPLLVNELTTRESPSFSPSAAKMQECVHLPREGEPIPEDYPGPQLVAFLEDLRDIQDAKLYRFLRKGAFLVAGVLATLLQLVAALTIVWLLTWCASHGQILPDTPLLLPLRTQVLAALSAGVLLCPAVVVALAAPSSAPNTSTAPLSAHLGWLAAVLLSSVTLYTGLFIVLPGLPGARPWLWMAVGAGVLLDHWRRIGWMRARSTIPVLSRDQTTKATSIGTLLDIPQVGPLTGALLSPAKPTVFISYTHRQGWSEQNAALLKRSLAHADVNGFIDRMIPHGSSWREAIDRRHGDANTFCVLLDRDCLDSAWIAAELQAAAHNQRSGGAPDIYLILDPGLDIPTRGALLKADIHGPQNYGPAVYVVRGSPEEYERIARYLGSAGYTSGGVSLPVKIQALAWRIFGVPLILLQSIGALGTILAWLAVPLLCALLLGAEQRWSVLSSDGVVLWGFLVSAYFAAFVTRLTVASRFEMRFVNPEVNSRFVWIMHAAMAFVFFDLAAYWGRSVHPVHVGWGLVIGGFAWMVARWYTATMRNAVPALRRDGV
ncbi:MAG: toll/interleukin-1 receptor domain-containing protein [Pseudomonadota bacterium]